MASAQLAEEFRHQRLVRFLERDPDNVSLLAEAATTALKEGAADEAREFLARHTAIAPLPPALENLNGILAISQQRFDDAIAAFTSLRRQDHDTPQIRFNLAWAYALTGAHREALELLDDEALTASPHAPMLRIRMMHHLGLLEEALANGEKLAERFSDNMEFMSALATLALDAERPELARRYAEKSADTAESRAALGVLTLAEHDSDASLSLFEKALQEQPDNARAWVGKGLALLMQGQNKVGADAIDQGATLFRNHVGSWVASGWAHFVNNDYAKARESFTRAIGIDANFAESHGGLAVVDIMDGRLVDAERNTEIALRLDKKCFGGALAKSLLLSQAGDTDRARRVRDIALSTPVGRNGETIAQALIGFSSRRTN